MRAPPRRGFTTVELMIAVTIIATLALLAYPTFQQQLRKGRRAEGITALANLQQAQERWRSTNMAYAANSLLTVDTGLRQDARTASGYYDIAIAIDPAPTAIGYVASATAVTGSSQAADTGCTKLWVRMDSGNLSYGAGTTVDWNDPNRCWAR